MRRSSYSGLRTIRGFLHANPVSFVDELTSIIIPTDLSTTFTFLRIFIRVDDRLPAMACFVGSQSRPGGEGHSGLILSHWAIGDIAAKRSSWGSHCLFCWLDHPAHGVPRYNSYYPASPG